MALILAGCVVIVTIGILVLVIGADMMSDSPTTHTDPVPVAVIGFGIAALLVASHWMPHLGW